MNTMDMILAAMAPGQGMNQTPVPQAQGVGRYGSGYSPNPNAPPAADPAPRVTPEAAQLLFNIHQQVAAENPELGRILWTKIQPFTGDF